MIQNAQCKKKPNVTKRHNVRKRQNLNVKEYSNIPIFSKKITSFFISQKSPFWAAVLFI